MGFKSRGIGPRVFFDCASNLDVSRNEDVLLQVLLRWDANPCTSSVEFGRRYCRKIFVDDLSPSLTIFFARLAAPNRLARLSREEAKDGAACECRSAFLDWLPMDSATVRDYSSTHTSLPVSSIVDSSTQSRVTMTPRKSKHDDPRSLINDHADW